MFRKYYVLAFFSRLFGGKVIFQRRCISMEKLLMASTISWHPAFVLFLLSHFPIFNIFIVDKSFPTLIPFFSDWHLDLNSPAISIIHSVRPSLPTCVSYIFSLQNLIFSSSSFCFILFSTLFRFSLIVYFGGNCLFL